MLSHRVIWLDIEYLKSAASLLAQFVDIQTTIQDIIVGMEYDNEVRNPCSCGSGERRAYRCCDCSNPTTMCKACIVEGHVNDQFHWIEEWEGRRFKRCDLGDIGLKIYLGHKGGMCPSGKEKKLTVVDINGIHKCTIVFCCCIEARGNATQMIDARIFPSTITNPRLGITFRCLKDFHTHTRASKKSAYDYARALERMTNDPSRVTVNVSLYLSASGNLYEIHN